MIFGLTITQVFMFGITDLTTYFLGATAIILLPGPNSLFCLTISAKQGIKAGYQAMLGILFGDTLLMLATVFGAGALLKLYPSLFHAVKIIGGLYLAYLGVNLIKGGVQRYRLRHTSISQSDPQSSPQPNNEPTKTPTKYSHFSRALFLSLTNPKAILFFLSFFVQFVDPHYANPLLSFLILAIILQLLSFAYLNMLIFSGHHLTKHFARQHTLASSGMVLMGLMFIGFAVKLWLANLH